MSITTPEELVELMARAIDPDRIELTKGHEDCDICLDARKTLLEKAREVIAALSAAGVVLVPEVATQKMYAAGYNSGTHPEYGRADNKRELCEYATQPIYTAMLNASPFKEMK